MKHIRTEVGHLSSEPQPQSYPKGTPGFQEREGIRIDYPICKDYVSHWGLWEATRELIQNAIDSGGHSREHQSNRLVITSYGDITRDCLLLGKSIKEDGSIGQFGEGLKLALLVLARMEIHVEIKTFKEVWTPSFGHSKQFDEEILSITIRDSELRDNVSVVIEMSEEEYDKISDKVLEDKTPRILEGMDSGTIFVGGLYVCKLDGFEYAYNFSPSMVKLNRDRDIPSMYDIRVAANQLLEGSQILKLAIEGKSEASEYTSTPSKLARAWKKEYPDTIPVGISEQDTVEAKNIKIIPDWLACIIRKAVK